MKIETITDKIIAQADAKLKARIEEASKPLDVLLRNGISYEISGPSGYSDDSPEFKACWYRAMNALKDAAFELHYERNRQNAINAFVTKFDSLHSQFEELRSEIE